MDTKTPNKHFFYEEFADDFDSKMNMYDTNKRIHVIFDELLPDDLTGKTLLDGGCGTGWFSKRATERGAIVTSMDLGERLLKKVKEKCNSTTITGSILEIPFPDNTFDFVISSEVIEHTENPGKAIDELSRVLKPGGKMVVTTPNRLWYFSVVIANALKLRPYQGIENWISWGTFSKAHLRNGMKIEAKRGIHILPFVSPLLYPILNFFHKFSSPLHGLMINMAIQSRKP